jgi:hypothetical protein
VPGVRQRCEALDLVREIVLNNSLYDKKRGNAMSRMNFGCIEKVKKIEKYIVHYVGTSKPY